MPLFHSFSVLAFPCTAQGVGFNLRSAFFRAIKIGDWVCEFIWLPHTLQPVQCFSGASTPVSNFTLKSANLLSAIEHFQAFSALSCLPPLIFTLKISKTCCPIPTALTYHRHSWWTVISDRFGLFFFPISIQTARSRFPSIVVISIHDRYTVVSNIQKNIPLL